MLLFQLIHNLAVDQLSLTRWWHPSVAAFCSVRVLVDLHFPSGHLIPHHVLTSTEKHGSSQLSVSLGR